MSNINQLVMESYLEEKVKSGYSGYKRKDVGSGIGKLAGNIVGGVPSTIAGHYIGKGSIKDPEDDIDEHKKSHRVGAITNKALSLKQAKHAGIGGAAGLGIGGTISKITGDPKYAAAGALLGGGAGFIGSSMKHAHTSAKKLGYGKVGRIGGAITPLVGLTTPKKLKEKLKKK